MIRDDCPGSRIWNTFIPDPEVKKHRIRIRNADLDSGGMNFSWSEKMLNFTASITTVLNRFFKNIFIELQANDHFFLSSSSGTSLVNQTETVCSGRRALHQYTLQYRYRWCAQGRRIGTWRWQSWGRETSCAWTPPWCRPPPAGRSSTCARNA